MSTRPNSTIVINPPLPQVASLRLWCEEKNKQKVLPPVSTEIRLITQVLGSANLLKDFWLRAKIRTANSNQRFFSLICTGCSRVMGVLVNMEFDCNYCRLRDTKPKPNNS